MSWSDGPSTYPPLGADYDRSLCIYVECDHPAPDRIFCACCLSPSGSCDEAAAV